MTTNVAFMPDKDTIIELELDDYTIVGTICKLRANVTQNDMADDIAEDVKLLMANDPEKAYERLLNQTVSDLEDQIWYNDYVLGDYVDSLGSIRQNDDDSLNYFEYDELGQCGNEIRKYLPSLKDRAVADALSKVLDIWDEHSVSNPITGQTRQEVSDLFDQINKSSNFKGMTADAISEDYLDRIEH